MVTASASDRRRPDRQQFILHLLRRLAILFLLMAALLALMPRALVELGVLGPGPEEAVQGAQSALEAARRYGARPDMPAFQAAQRELARAQELIRQGNGREGRRAAAGASELAIEAQKQALVRQAETQARAEVIYNDLDRQINDLERLYSAVTPALEKEKVRELLGLMKVTRQATGLVFLAYEQKDWDRVLENEGHAREVVTSTRGTLQSQRR